MDSTQVQTARPAPAATVSRSVQAKLVRFAAGESSEQERDEVKKLLLDQPSLVPVLVNTLRSLTPRR